MEYLSDKDQLVTLLAQIATGGLSVPIIKWLFERGYFGGLTREARTVIAGGLTFIFVIGAALLLIGLGHYPMPADLYGLLMALAPAFGVAYTSSRFLFEWLRNRNPQFSKPKQ